MMRLLNVAVLHLARDRDEGGWDVDRRAREHGRRRDLVLGAVRAEREDAALGRRLEHAGPGGVGVLQHEAAAAVDERERRGARRADVVPVPEVRES